MKLTRVLLILVLALVLVASNVHATLAKVVVEDQEQEHVLDVDNEVAAVDHRLDGDHDHQESLESNSIVPNDDDGDNDNGDDDDDDEQELSPQHGIGRVLGQKKNKKLRLKPRRRLTCNRFPRICGARGSPGPHCCKKRCVNVLIDRNNCGMCGKKCKFNQICCGGKCVNPSFNKRHCGGCNNRCENGGFCVFGLCSYA